MLAGRMRHRDNHGNSGLLVPGGAQWMTAGPGIVHSEMPEQEDGLMRGFQLWVNLPAQRQDDARRATRTSRRSRSPQIEPAPGARVRVIAGALAGAQGPVSGIATRPLFLDVALAAGAALDVPLPAGHNGFVYVFEGASVTIGDSVLDLNELGVYLALATSCAWRQGARRRG